MSLYTPRHFSAPTKDDVVALMHAHAFATLITGTEGEPAVTHLPLLWEPGGEFGILYGHMVRASPHWQQFARGHTLATFHGPHAYISPPWYVHPDREVPTWNYATVCAHGTPELVDDPGAKLALIDRSVAVFEAGNTPPWARVAGGDRLDARLRAIVAFRMPIAHAGREVQDEPEQDAGGPAAGRGTTRVSARSRLPGDEPMDARP